MASKKKTRPAESVPKTSSGTGKDTEKASRSRKRPQPALAAKDSVTVVRQPSEPVSKAGKQLSRTASVRRDEPIGEHAPTGSTGIMLDPEEREIVIESLIFRRNHLPGYLQAFHRKLDVIKNLLKKLSE